jgi:hypothetical protein
LGPDMAWVPVDHVPVPDWCWYRPTILGDFPGKCWYIFQHHGSHLGLDFISSSSSSSATVEFSSHQDCSKLLVNRCHRWGNRLSGWGSMSNTPGTTTCEWVPGHRKTRGCRGFFSPDCSQFFSSWAETG